MRTKKCETCSNSGLVFVKDTEGTKKTYRCSCEAGRHLSGALFMKSGNPDEREIEVPIYEPGMKETHESRNQ